jgi:hypothetical protein
MYDPPAYIWAISITIVAGIGAATCAVLYSGTRRAGLGRSRAALIAGSAAALFAGWFTATGIIAGKGWYHAPLSRGPWMPIAIIGFLALLLALGQTPVVASALAAPGMVSRLVWPHIFRVEGVVFLLYLALGRLPAVFALPAGLDDIATGIWAPLIARRLGAGTGRRAALWFNGFGLTDLVTALALGAVTGFGLTDITPSGAPISELPLALIPTAGVPLLFALHITSVRALVRTGRPACADAVPRIAESAGPA